MMETVMEMEENGLTIKESARFDYSKELDDFISNIQPGHDIENRWRKSLIPVRETLNKEKISADEYNQIGLEMQRVSLLFSDEMVLSKLLVYSSVKLLKKGVNHLVGSSFYPSNEALESVFLDGKNLTQDEYKYIFVFLARKTNDEIVFPSNFLEDALDNIRKEREKHAE